MIALEASGHLIELVRANEDIANHAGGCDEEGLLSAEARIGVVFPPSYRRLVEEFGTWDIAGQEFLGVYRTERMGDALLGAPSETLDARLRYGLPSHLLVVMYDGMGGLVVLDTSKSDDDGESPVSVWSPGVANSEHSEAIGKDFGNFALGLSQRAVAAWRGAN